MNKRNLSVQELRDMLLAQRFAEDKLGARLNKEALTMLSEQTFIQKRAYFWFFLVSLQTCVTQRITNYFRPMMIFSRASTFL